MKLLIGGSPCTYWSIAQTKNRETEASGMGWELFKNFLIARDKYKPDYFLYENNKSMSPAIRAQITKEFGFEPVMIDSALVSAQSRKRLYWLGRREPDGTYSRVNVELPEDRGIILRNILETGVAYREKAYTLDANYHKTTGVFNPKKQHRYSRLQAAEIVTPGKALTDREMEYMVRPIASGGNHFDFGYIQDGTKDKGKCVTANISKGVPYNVIIDPIKYTTANSQEPEMTSENDCLHICGDVEMVCENQDGQMRLLAMEEQPTYIAEPMRVCNIDGGGQGNRIYSVDAKSCAIKANSGGLGGNGQGLYADPIRVGDLPNAVGEIKGSQSKRIYSIDGKSVPIQAGETAGGCSDTASNRTGLIAEPVRIGTIESNAKSSDHDSQAKRVYSPDGKSTTLLGCGGGLAQRPDCMQCRSAGANACPGGNQARICGNHAGGNVWTCQCCPARQGGADE